MSRKRTITSIESEISKVKVDLEKTQNKYDKLAERLLVLQKQRYEYEAEQIMNAFGKSGKSYRELMTFLGV